MPTDAKTVNVGEPRMVRSLWNQAGSLTGPGRGGILARRYSLGSIEIYDKTFLRGVVVEATR